MAAAVDSEEIFSNLASKFTQLLQVRTQDDRNILEQTLSELNLLNYSSHFVKNTKALLLINQCCSLLLSGDEVLVPKFCKLIKDLVGSQSVLIEGRTLSMLINWFFEGLKTDNKAVQLDILLALQRVIQNNNNKNLFIPQIIKTDSPIVKLAGPNNDPDIILLAVQCLETTIYTSEYRPLQAEQFHCCYITCTEIFKYHLDKGPNNISEIDYCKIQTICLRGLMYIVCQDNLILKSELGYILGYIKTYMVYGIENVEFLLPCKITPSMLSIPEPSTRIPREKKGGKVPRQRKHRTGSKTSSVEKEWVDDEVPLRLEPNYNNCNSQSDTSASGNISSRFKSSESEYSDSERARKDKVVYRNLLRRAALELFLPVIKYTDKKVMFSYWSSFIPDSSISGKHNLMTSLLRTPSGREKKTALNIIVSLLDSAKFYLSQAEMSDKTASFTPYSVLLGLSIRELHRCLNLALNDWSISNLIQVLKCLSALVQTTPYSRLEPGMITKIIRNVKKYLFHKDVRIQSAVLIVFFCILGSEPVLQETTDALTKYDQSIKDCSETDKENIPQSLGHHDDIEYAEFSSDEEDSGSKLSGTNQIPWILEKLILNLGVQPNGELVAENVIASPVKLESLQVLSAMSRSHFETLMAPHIPLIAKAVNLSLMDKNIDIKLKAGKLVEFIGQAMDQYFSNKESNLLSVDQAVQFWETLLKESLTSFFTEDQPLSLKTTGCDCIGSIGPHVFGCFSRNTAILCQTLLLGCSRDEDIGVKAAAVRSLAISVLYPTLREDYGFVEDTAIVVHALLQNDNLTARMKASWALANVSDCLVLISSGSKLIGKFRLTLLLVLIHASIKACKDNDKVKVNAVRSLGNLLQTITRENYNILELRQEFINATLESVNALVKCAKTGSNVKVRWNACYALGGVLKSEPLYYVKEWMTLAFTTLLYLVKTHANFKVRINAAVALSGPSTRAMYGVYYQEIYVGLLDALAESSNTEDPTEYNHKDHLIEEICISIAHLTTLLKSSDLFVLSDDISAYNESLTNHVRRVIDRLLPEKTNVFFNAEAHIKAIKQDRFSTPEEEITWEVLNIVFSNS